ncbi:heme peroxidase [Phlyctochytrium planicorne]|nr:heme peroxidase [Phlyctochytrium planicorne]
MFVRNLLTVAQRTASFSKPTVLRAAAITSFSAPRTTLLATRRGYSSGSGEKSSSSSFVWIAALAALGGAGYFYQDDLKKALSPAPPRVLDAAYYQDVYNAIAAVLDNADYDDGSYGPVLVRLAWHAAGTYDINTKTGGSNGSTMRFDPEASHGANAGLKIARDLLEPIKKKFPEISYADLWSLAGVAAVQEMGGPVIPWRAGRADAASAEACTPDGRLPDAAQGQDHLRNVFYRQGFNDQEIVALAGAHALGRCHTDRSGFSGPWTRAPTTFSNDYFQRLIGERWVEKKWDGPKQFADKATGDLMMLPADLALIKDRAFSKHVYAYAKDSNLFFKDFAAAYKKLLENGVPFKEGAPVFTFKATA